jgi:hypothetical protein
MFLCALVLGGTSAADCNVVVVQQTISELEPVKQAPEYVELATVPGSSVVVAGLGCCQQAAGADDYGWCGSRSNFLCQVLNTLHSLALQ